MWQLSKLKSGNDEKSTTVVKQAANKTACYAGINGLR